MDDTRYPVASIVGDFHDRYRIGRVRPSEDLADGGIFRRFRSIIYGYFKRYGRDLPWRRTDDPFHILVSEVMLQQTQVARVAQKFPEFIEAFPTVEALASASLDRVLSVWRGMGYNRRARHLRDIARLLAEAHGGLVPDDHDILASLPGIGPATAASILAFAFNRPTVFIETNIRAVFIHFFFPKGNAVSDGAILPLVESAVDRRAPRRWYSALMDYGAMLKRRFPNPSRVSDRHRRQKPFQGSMRQLRGMTLRALLDRPGLTPHGIARLTGWSREDVKRAIEMLCREGLVEVRGEKVYLAED